MEGGNTTTLWSTVLDDTEAKDQLDGEDQQTTKEWILKRPCHESRSNTAGSNMA